MAKQTKFYVHLSGLISQARLQNGFATLRELYREKNPPIDYQTWLHAEAGRRIPSSAKVMIMGDILKIDREALIIAYCKDKFDDQWSHQVINSFQYKKYIDLDTLIEAKEHERTLDYVFNAEQIKAIQSDIRLRLYLNYTYDQDLKTTFSRLATYFGVPIEEVREVVDRLQSLGLVEVIQEEVKRIHRHTTLPNTADLCQVRKESLLKSLELNIEPNSYTANYHISISDKSYKKILAIFELVEATLIKMEKDDRGLTNNLRIQTVMVGNNLNEGDQNGR